MILGFDAAAFAAAMPTRQRADVLAKAKQHCKFVMLYTKYAAPELITQIHAAGLAVGLVFESSASRMLGGAAAGTADAQSVLRVVFGDLTHHGLSANPPPQETAIFFACDFDEQSVQDALCGAYLGAAHAVLGTKLTMGVYGNGGICAKMLSTRAVVYTWLAGGMGMRGTRDFLATGKATLVQDVGDKRGLNLGIPIDSDYSNYDNLTWAWRPPLRGQASVGGVLDEAAIPPKTIPRRNQIELLTPAELTVRSAVQAVEALPADPLLTEAVVLLGQAQGKVADYIDAHGPPKET